jgi:hypothetical protein
MVPASALDQDRPCPQRSAVLTCPHCWALADANDKPSPTTKAPFMTQNRLHYSWRQYPHGRACSQPPTLVALWPSKPNKDPPIFPRLRVASRHPTAVTSNAARSLSDRPSMQSAMSYGWRAKLTWNVTKPCVFRLSGYSVVPRRCTKSAAWRP